MNEFRCINMENLHKSNLVLPSITYGSETWRMIKEVKKKLVVAQRKIELKILGITLRDGRTNECIRRRTRVDDIVEVPGRNKWQWVGHLAR